MWKGVELATGLLVPTDITTVALIYPFICARGTPNRGFLSGGYNAMVTVATAGRYARTVR